MFASYLFSVFKSLKA